MSVGGGGGECVVLPRGNELACLVVDECVCVCKVTFVLHIARSFVSACAM